MSTQVNVMHHISQARRNSQAKLVVIDPYRTKTADKADLHLMLKPGTDGALACAVMHVMLEEVCSANIVATLVLLYILRIVIASAKLK